MTEDESINLIRIAFKEESIPHKVSIIIHRLIQYPQLLFTTTPRTLSCGEIECDTYLEYLVRMNEESTYNKIFELYQITSTTNNHDTFRPELTKNTPSLIPPTSYERTRLDSFDGYTTTSSEASNNLTAEYQEFSMDDLFEHDEYDQKTASPARKDKLRTDIFIKHHFSKKEVNSTDDNKAPTIHKIIELYSFDSHSSTSSQVDNTFTPEGQTFSIDDLFEYDEYDQKTPSPTQNNPIIGEFSMNDAFEH